MTVAEKRSVLASWASDACAIGSNPALRASATRNVISYDDIIDALQALDAGQSADTVTYAFKRRQWRRRWSDGKAQTRRARRRQRRLDVHHDQRQRPPVARRPLELPYDRLVGTGNPR
jgi:hypothetical protein